MPVFELGQSRQGRLRGFTRAQLPLLFGAVFVSAEGAFALPDAFRSPAAVLGVAFIIAASVLFVVLPWERWATSLLILLAVADVIGVAFLRLAYFSDLPSVGILTVFPVLWLAYAFRRWTIVLAILGAVFITVLPVIVERSLPHTALGVASIITLPVIVIGLALTVGQAARQLARTQRRTHDINVKLERSLSRAEDGQSLTRMLLETVDVAIAFYDSDRRLVMANAQAVQAVAAAGFRLDVEPFAGLEVRRSNNVDPIPFDEQVIPRALRGDLDGHEMEWIGPLGQQTAIVAFSSEVARADGTKWGTLIAVHDITDLARSLQVKDEFIATVSHELRTPLTSIVGYLEVLSDELNDADPFILESLAASTRNAIKLQSRIEELLATAEQRQTLDIKRSDMALVIRQAVEAQRRQAETGHVTIHENVLPELWGSFDADRMEQVIDNLLSNAIKYAPAGHIVISANRVSDDLVVKVSDDGVGMNPDEAAQAFDTFWRADHARRGAVQGIGIGLSLALRLVEAHRGTIRMDSAPGEGTTFTVTLPA